jgi:coenzyme PQQ synthesis protein D (PqqD)
VTAPSDGTVTADSVVALPLNIKIRNYQGRTLVSGYEHAFELSESAGFVCRQVDGIRTIGDIGRIVAEEFDVDERTATEDAIELLDQLVAHDILVVRA